MRRLRNFTAFASVLTMLLGGILGTLDWAGSKALILVGVVILLLVYIPIFLYDISKRWGDDDQVKS